MNQFALFCPYCAKQQQAIAKRTGFFTTSCISCSCEFGTEILLPDYAGTFKISGLPENPKQYQKSLKK